MRRINECCSCGCGGDVNGCMKKPDNYMFFGNLESIKRHIDAMLEMDPRMIDSILSKGHGWAVDHISSSLDDIQEVANFLMSAKPQEESHPLLGIQMNGAFSNLAKSFESFTVNEAKKKAKKKKVDLEDINAADDIIAKRKIGSTDKKRAMALVKKYNLK